MFSDAATIKTFVIAGRGTLTLSSVKTGGRFTYRVRPVPNATGKWFIQLLTGPNNETDYQYRYLGMLVSDHLFQFKFWLTAKSCARDEAPSVIAFRYLVDRVLKNASAPLPTGLEVRHDNRCGRCSRLLTTPESVDRGIGPECASKLGLFCSAEAA